MSQDMFLITWLLFCCPAWTVCLLEAGELSFPWACPVSGHGSTQQTVCVQ